MKLSKKPVRAIFAFFALTLSLSFAQADHNSRFDHDDYRTRIEFCGIGENTWYCRAAIQGRPGFRAIGCIGAYGESGSIPALTPENVYRTYVAYGYQRRPRREYNNVRQPTWYFNADSYDWACVYTAIEIRR